jgi:hypothetical protein
MREVFLGVPVGRWLGVEVVGCRVFRRMIGPRPSLWPRLKAEARPRPTFWVASGSLVVFQVVFCRVGHWLGSPLFMSLGLIEHHSSLCLAAPLLTIVRLDPSERTYEIVVL